MQKARERKSSRGSTGGVKVKKYWKIWLKIQTHQGRTHRIRAANVIAGSPRRKQPLPGAPLVTKQHPPQKNNAQLKTKINRRKHYRLNRSVPERRSSGTINLKATKNQSNQPGRNLSIGATAFGKICGHSYSGTNSENKKENAQGNGC